MNNKERVHLRLAQLLRDELAQERSQAWRMKPISMCSSYLLDHAELAAAQLYDKDFTY